MVTPGRMAPDSSLAVPSIVPDATLCANASPALVTAIQIIARKTNQRRPSTCVVITKLLCSKRVCGPTLALRCPAAAIFSGNYGYGSYEITASDPASGVASFRYGAPFSTHQNLGSYSV